MLGKAKGSPSLSLDYHIMQMCAYTVFSIFSCGMNSDTKNIARQEITRDLWWILFEMAGSDHERKHAIDHVGMYMPYLAYLLWDLRYVVLTSNHTRASTVPKHTQFGLAAEKHDYQRPNYVVSELKKKRKPNTKITANANRLKSI